MFGTRKKPTVTQLNGEEFVTVGQRLNNLTIKKHYQIEYPQDLN